MPSREQRPQFRPQTPRASRQRPLDTQDIRERFLIVCEGEKTEPNYFRAFRTPGRVLDVQGTGRNTLSLVDEAIRLKDEAQGRAAYDQAWCVFDRDSFPSDAFNSAVRKAEANGFRVAYSNEAFELWYLLHFHYHDAAISRVAYRDKLNECLGRRYEKNDTALYEELLSRQTEAIRNARHLLEHYLEDNPQRNTPSTTVHLLVEQLNKSAGL